MQMSEGFLGQIRDNLANIDVAAAWIRDMPEGAREGLNWMKAWTISGAEAGPEPQSHRQLHQSEPALRGPMIVDVDVHRMLDDLLQIFERELEFHHIRVERDFKADPGRSCAVIPHVCGRSFQNLLLNAVARDSEKAGVIRIRTGSGDQWVQVEIEDDGPGYCRTCARKKYSNRCSRHGPRALDWAFRYAANNLEKLGGRISVTSRPGRGGHLPGRNSGKIQTCREMIVFCFALKKPCVFGQFRERWLCRGVLKKITNSKHQMTNKITIKQKFQTGSK